MKRIDKTYWVGWFKDGPFQILVVNEEGEFKMPELFTTKKNALKYYDDVRKVRIVEVKK